MKLGYWQEAVKAQQRTFATVRLVDYGDLCWKDFIKFAHQESAAARVLTGAVAPSGFDEVKHLCKAIQLLLHSC